jgi:hypothetical protein
MQKDKSIVLEPDRFHPQRENKLTSPIIPCISSRTGTELCEVRDGSVTIMEAPIQPTLDILT